MSDSHTTYDSIDLVTTVTVEDDGKVTAVAEAARQKVRVTKQGVLERVVDGSHRYWSIRTHEGGYLMHSATSRASVLREIGRSAAASAATYAVHASV